MIFTFQVRHFSNVLEESLWYFMSGQHLSSGLGCFTGSVYLFHAFRPCLNACWQFFCSSFDNSAFTTNVCVEVSMWMSVLSSEDSHA